jgi:hypothetical protein
MSRTPQTVDGAVSVLFLAQAIVLGSIAAAGLAIEVWTPPPPRVRVEFCKTLGLRGEYLEADVLVVSEEPYDLEVVPLFERGPSEDPGFRTIPDAIEVARPASPTCAPADDLRFEFRDDRSVRRGWPLRMRCRWLRWVPGETNVIRVRLDSDSTTGVASFTHQLRPVSR